MSKGGMRWTPEQLDRFRQKQKRADFGSSPARAHFKAAADALREPTRPPVVGTANDMEKPTWIDPDSERRAFGAPIGPGGLQDGIPELTDAISRGTKYRNRKTGHYQSKREATRAADLALLEQAGEIFDLHEQTIYLLIPSQKDAKGRVLERACSYIADFTYRRRLTGSLIVEDCKSEPTKTPAYVIKRKLMLLVHGIRIVEV